MKQYSIAKASGIKGVFAWSTGVEVYGLVQQIGKGIVIDYGKRKLAGICFVGMGYIGPIAAIVLTNATKIVKIAKNVHWGAAFVFECIEDSANLTFLPIDLALFGQPVPIGKPNRFNLFNSIDIFDID